MVCHQLLQNGDNFLLRKSLAIRCLPTCGRDNLQGSCYVEPDIWNGVSSETQKRIDDFVAYNFDIKRWCDRLESQSVPEASRTARVEKYPNSLNSGHPIKVVWMRSHGNYLGHNLRPGPLHTEYLRQFFEIDRRSLPNAVYRISQPRHAQARELFVEEVLAKLRGQ